MENPDGRVRKPKPFEGCGVACGGYNKGKTAIHMAGEYGEHKRNFFGQST
jgi:hypothetical protein